MPGTSPPSSPEENPETNPYSEPEIRLERLRPPSSGKKTENSGKIRKTGPRTKISETETQNRNSSRKQKNKSRKKKPLTKLEISHNRVILVGMGFLGLFGALAIKALFATVIAPLEPLPGQIASQIPDIPQPDPMARMSDGLVLPNVHRATITDRNGQPLAISLPVVAVYANPREVIDVEEAAGKINTVLPRTKIEDLITRLKQKKRQFVYLARDITPAQERAVNNLGIPGIYFMEGEKRRYPLGNTAAQIMGAVDIDDHGIAGVERYFDQRLRENMTPLRLSLDTRVQAAMHDELAQSMQHFQAIGACAILMDVRTGEIISMVSLPDYNANDFSHAPPYARFNRAVTGMYEPGSTFKLQTAAMALELNIAHIWDRFSTIPIHIGRFKISDLKSDHFAPWLSLPAVMAYSSNPAAAHIALDVGAERQRNWLQNMGFLDRVPVELPEAGRPIIPSRRNWSTTTVMTVGFGHGIAESPLAIVRGTAATGNGGILVTPTLQAQDSELDDNSGQGIIPATKPQGPRVLSEHTSDILRRILRLVVTEGIGKRAESPGYFVGGKTGTAEKISAHGTYLKHVNITAFTGLFPMNAPRYALYVMLDAPQPTPETHGWTTAGWIAAPLFSKIVTRTAPMLGLFPADTGRVASIEASLNIPMNPPVPRGLNPLGPGNDPGTARIPQRRSHSHSSP